MSATFDTDLYGDMSVTCTDGAVEAAYVDNPKCRISIRRIGAISHRRTPLGTRDPRAVEVESTVGGVTIRPRRGRVTKRSYRVDVVLDGVALDLSPKDLVTSEFRLSTIDVAHNVFAEMTRRADGTIDLIFSAPIRLGNRTFEPPVPSREQLLVAVSLAAAFGTGGLSLTTIVMNAVDAVLP